jgi:hypothetical protein
VPKEEKPLEYKPRVHDTKGVAQRINLDYVKQTASIVLLRKRFIWAMVAAAVLISVPLGLGIGVGRRTLENGPVSSAHALFETRCESCHAQAFKRVPDAACTQCHDGAAHPAKTVDAGARLLTSAPRCGECHIEHRGRLQLADVGNGFCTNCHADLIRNATELKVKADKITSFAPGQHPEFSAAAQPDTRPLKLNHAKHMPAKPKTVDGNKLPMTCSDCHVGDRNSATNALLPVSFDQNCKSCHARELEFDVYRVLGPNAMPAPHTRDKTTIDAFVRAAFTDKLRDAPEIARRPLGEGLKPEVSATAWLDRVVRDSEAYLFDRKCIFCHKAEPMANRVHRIVGRYSADKGDGEPWLPRGEFSHRSHRSEECSSCHTKALTSEKTEDVLIPDMKNCISCHGQTVGQMNRCSMCHQYHNRSLEQERRRPLEKLMSALTPALIRK